MDSPKLVSTYVYQVTRADGSVSYRIRMTVKNGPDKVRSDIPTLDEAVEIRDKWIADRPVRVKTVLDTSNLRGWGW